MRRTLLILAILIALPVSALALTGDCDGNGTVELGELVRGVVIALGTRPLQDCDAFDANGDGLIDVSELVDGVAESMTEVTATPTPNATATITPTDTVAPEGTPTDTPPGGATATSTASPTATSSLVATGTSTVSPTATLTGESTPTSTRTGESTPTATPTGESTRTASPSATATATATSESSPTSTASASVTSAASPTSTATPSVTVQSTATPTETATRTATRTATLTASPTNTRTSTATLTPTVSRTSTGTATSTPTPTATRTPTVTSTPSPTVTPTLPHFVVFDFGSAGTGGIPCITTTINFLLLAGTTNVTDLRFDFCTDPDSFDVGSITCQSQNVAAVLDPVDRQPSCDLEADDPHGQVRVSVHGAGGAALPDGEVLFQCSVPVLPTTVTGQYAVDYSIRGMTTGDVPFLDFGQSTINIFADDLSQGQCCGVDSQCSSGFCRGGFQPEMNSVCCESECGTGVCNDPLALGTCLEQPGGEFRVSSVTYRTHFEPSAVVLDDGFVVAWYGNALDIFDNLTDVFARRYDRFGAPVAEVTVNETLVGAQRSASVGSLGSNFVVVWSDPYGVHGQRFDALAAALGSEFEVNSLVNGSQYYNTAVGGAPDGGFIVLWDGYGFDGFGDGIFGRRYDSLGDSVGDQFQVNAYTEGSEHDPAIAFRPDGSFVVAWGANERGIAGQLFDSVGERIGSEFVAPDLFSPPNLADSPPGLGVDDNAGFVIAATGVDGSYFGGVFARRFNSAGVAVGAAFQVNTYTYATQRNPHIAFGQNAEFVVVWEGSGQDGYNYGIFGQRFGSSGARLGTEFQVTVYTSSNEREPAIAAGPGTDGFVVVWQGKGGYQYQGILGRRLP